jgi:4-oxalocrotonate tautomerase
MPLVDIHLIKGAWTPEQKEQMMKATTDALVGIWGENVRKLTWVRVLEVEDGDWMIAGEVFRLGDVGRLQRGEI